eukprot:2469833-Amphidinium_carterae.2
MPNKFLLIEAVFAHVVSCATCDLQTSSVNGCLGSNYKVGLSFRCVVGKMLPWSDYHASYKTCWPAIGAGKARGGKREGRVTSGPGPAVGAGGQLPGKGRGAGEVTHDGAETYVDVPPSWSGPRLTIRGISESRSVATYY